jgi:hypothetical protein
MKNSFQLSGWEEILGIYMKLRKVAGKYWEKTGRKAYFIPKSI